MGDLTRACERFVAKSCKDGSYLSEKELVNLLDPVMRDIAGKESPNKLEVVSRIVSEIEGLARDILVKLPTPGVTIGIRTQDTWIKVYGGYRRQNEPMTGHELFDIASMTKFYTQMILYNIIYEGIISIDDAIRQLSPKFRFLSDITVRDISEFGVSFIREKHLSTCKTIQEAINALYAVKPHIRGVYDYNDEGTEILKEVLEEVTSQSYESLLRRYIINPLSLSETHVNLPSCCYDRITGTPNARLGFVNDPSAVALGGYSGHAGIFASADDLLHLGSSFHGGIIVPPEYASKAYTPGINACRGVMGNTYLVSDDPDDTTFLDRSEPTTSFAVQGSTRCQLNVGKDHVYAILLNPASMEVSEAADLELELNDKRKGEGREAVRIIKAAEFTRGDRTIRHTTIDPRPLFPVREVMKPIIEKVAVAVLQLRFVEFCLPGNHVPVVMERQA